MTPTRDADTAAVTSREGRPYEVEARGHEWLRNDDGSVDIFGYDGDTHNGPRCVKCGYGFCHHCQSLPDEDCDGGAAQAAAAAKQRMADAAPALVEALECAAALDLPANDGYAVLERFGWDRAGRLEFPATEFVNLKVRAALRLAQGEAK